MLPEERLKSFGKLIDVLRSKKNRRYADYDLIPNDTKTTIGRRRKNKRTPTNASIHTVRVQIRRISIGIFFLAC